MVEGCTRVFCPTDLSLSELYTGQVNKKCRKRLQDRKQGGKVQEGAMRLKTQRPPSQAAAGGNVNRSGQKGSDCRFDQTSRIRSYSLMRRQAALCPMANPKTNIITPDTRAVISGEPRISIIDLLLAHSARGPYVAPEAATSRDCHPFQVHP